MLQCWPRIDKPPVYQNGVEIWGQPPEYSGFIMDLFIRDSHKRGAGQWPSNAILARPHVNRFPKSRWSAYKGALNWTIQCHSVKSETYPLVKWVKQVCMAKLIKFDWCRPDVIALSTDQTPLLLWLWNLSTSFQPWVWHDPVDRRESALQHLNVQQVDFMKGCALREIGFTFQNYIVYFKH